MPGKGLLGVCQWPPQNVPGAPLGAQRTSVLACDAKFSWIEEQLWGLQPGGGGRAARLSATGRLPFGVSVSLSLSLSRSLLGPPLASLPLPVCSPPPTPGRPVGCPEVAAEWAPCSRPRPPLRVTRGQALAARCLKGPAPRGRGGRAGLCAQAPPLAKMVHGEGGGRHTQTPQPHVVRGQAGAGEAAWGRGECTHVACRAWV